MLSQLPNPIPYSKFFNQLDWFDEKTNNKIWENLEFRVGNHVYQMLITLCSVWPLYLAPF